MGLAKLLKSVYPREPPKARPQGMIIRNCFGKQALDAFHLWIERPTLQAGEEGLVVVCSRLQIAQHHVQMPDALQLANQVHGPIDEEHSLLCLCELAMNVLIPNHIYPEHQHLAHMLPLP